jgi:hypothetical protein
MKILERVITGTLGALLVGAGIYALVLGDAASAWRYLGGVALCVLGGNAAYGAAIGKRPWISKIGPLP